MLAIDLVCSQSFISGSFLLSLPLPLSSSSAAGCLSFFFFWRGAAGFYSFFLALDLLQLMGVWVFFFFFWRGAAGFLLFLFGFRSSSADGCLSFFLEEKLLGFCSFFLATDFSRSLSLYGRVRALKDVKYCFAFFFFGQTDTLKERLRQRDSGL